MLTEIVNHLWQSTLLAAAIAALVALLRDQGAHVRYWLWWTASMKFLVPFSLLTLVGSALGGLRGPLLDLDAWPATLGLLAEPMPETARWTPGALALVGVWAIGFGAVGTRWLVRALGVRALLRTSTPYAGALTQLGGGPEARMSGRLVEPTLVGIARPVLVLPRGIAEHLSRPQLDAVLAHELSHWRRRDNLTAAAHMLVEAVFWFHPLVWWIGTRLVEERERACDEAVLRAGHDGPTYADAILDVCERYVASRIECAAGVSGADLKRRVVEIARNRVISELPVQKKILLGAFALCTLLVPIIFGTVSGRVAAQGDSDVVPLVRIAPTYPPEAISAGRDGDVRLRFTIDANGATKDIVVEESTSPEFEQPATAALKRWIYAPRVVDGEPVERRDVLTIIRFRIDCASRARDPEQPATGVAPNCSN